jgi:formate-dependent nitrite reductase membrane component NrfD
MPLLQSPHWPVLIDVYFFLGGLAGGAFVIATIANLLDARRFREVSRVGYYLALAALIPCPLILIVDLGVPMRFLNMLRAFNPLSPMSMGAWALLGFGVCAFAAALMTLLEDLGRARNLSGPKIVAGGIGGFFGFFLAAYPGVLLGASTRPLWTDGHALGALFLAVGASTGAAAMVLILMLLGRPAGEDVGTLRTMLVLALLIQLLSVVIFVGSVQASGTPSSVRAFASLTSGVFGVTFWLGAVLLGSIVPLVIGLVDLRRRSPGLTAAASILVLVGGFLVKYVLVAAGQA